MHRNHYLHALSNFISSVEAGEAQDDRDIRIAREAVDGLSPDAEEMTITLSYEEACEIIRDRCENHGDNAEYERGMTTMVADLFAIEDLDTDTRMEQVTRNVWGVRWVVGISDPPRKLREFDTEDEAVAFVGTLDGVEDGIYYVEPVTPD